MQTSNMADENFKKLAEIFPNIVTETIDENGNVVRAINKELLEQEISTKVVDGPKERYEFIWPEKKQSIIAANAPTTNTLRPSVEDSVNFDTTKNLYIEGDNLEVLKILQETYLGKVKMIYIDPPYNTGNNILYINDFGMTIDDYMEISNQTDEIGNQLILNTETNGRFHTDWLNIMYPRLKLARNLLTDDGFIVLAIDHNELSNLIAICDEVFGFNNRIGLVTVVHKPEGRNQEKFFGTSNEFALFYAKNKKASKFNEVAISEDVLKTFTEKDEIGLYRLNNYRRDGGGDSNLRKNKSHFWYPIYVSKDLKDISLKSNEDYLEIFPVTSTGVERTWKTSKDTFIDRLKNNLIIAQRVGNRYEIFEKYYEQQVIKTHWIEKKYHAIHYGTNIIKKLLGEAYFDFPKSIYLLEDIIKLTANKESMILDIFSGSATTAHAVMQLNAEDGGNRQFIMVQLQEETDEKSEAYKAGYKNICEIGKERIRRAGAKIKEDFKDQEGIEDLDIGFRVLKVDSSNMEDVYYNPLELQQDILSQMTDNIKADRNDLDLLFQVMLDMGIEISSKIDEFYINNKKCFSVEDDFLIACFDKDIDTDLVKEIAKKKPVYAVILNRNMINDSLLTNFDQIFKEISPDTVRKVL